MLMRAKDSTLLVIDLQERLLPAIDGGAAVIEQAAWLVQVAQRLEVPVIATEQYPKGLGATEGGLRALLPREGLREKIHFSATAGAGLFDLPAASASSSSSAVRKPMSACCRRCSACWRLGARCSWWTRPSARVGRATRPWAWRGWNAPGR